MKWSEYDGRESVTINYERYLIYHIKHIIDDTSLSSNEKITHIEELYIEYDLFRT